MPITCRTSKYFENVHGLMNCHWWTITVLSIAKSNSCKIKDGYISCRCFLKHLFFSQPDWYIEPDQKCTLPLVKNGKIGNTSCLLGNLNILGYMHIVSMRTFVPSKMVIHQCIRKLLRGHEMLRTDRLTDGFL